MDQQKPLLTPVQLEFEEPDETQYDYLAVNIPPSLGRPAVTSTGSGAVDGRPSTSGVFLPPSPRKPLTSPRRGARPLSWSQYQEQIQLQQQQQQQETECGPHTSRVSPEPLPPAVTQHRSTATSGSPRPEDDAPRVKKPPLTWEALNPGKKQFVQVPMHVRQVVHARTQQLASEQQKRAAEQVIEDHERAMLLLRSTARNTTSFTIAMLSAQAGDAPLSMAMFGSPPPHAPVPPRRIMTPNKMPHTARTGSPPRGAWLQAITPATAREQALKAGFRWAHTHAAPVVPIPVPSPTFIRPIKTLVPPRAVRQQLARSPRPETRAEPSPAPSELPVLTIPGANAGGAGAPLTPEQAWDDLNW